MESGQPFPVMRGLRAVLLSAICALMLMPALTLIPRLLFWGGPFGPFFAVFIAPFIGLWVGPFVAPLTASATVLALSAMVVGLTRLSRTVPVATTRWVWLLCGLASGAAVGTILGIERPMFGFELPGTAISGAVTGMLSALLARRIMAKRV